MVFRENFVKNISLQGLQEKRANFMGRIGKGIPRGKKQM